MFKLFRRTSKRHGGGPEAPVPEPPPPSADTASVPVVATPTTPPAVITPDWPLGAMIRVEEHRQDDALVVRAVLPGIDPAEDVSVTVANGHLTIEAARREETADERDGYVRREVRAGMFSRTLPLPAGVTADAITATYEDGVLEVRVPIGASEAPARTSIPVTTS